MSDSGFVVVAHVVRAQGRNGELIAEILTDFPERFAGLSHAWMLSPDRSTAPREIALERHWLHKGRIVLKFAGVDSIADAEAYRGWDVAVPREQRIPLKDDSFYIADLIGCHVVDEANGSVDLGPVLDVLRGKGGTANLLVLKQADGELLIPFARSYVVAVEPDARLIRMRLPAGLTGINAPMTQEEGAQQHATEKDDGSDAF